MRDELKALFRELEPPPGGAAALRRRLRDEPRRGRVRIATLGLVGALAAAGLAVTVHRAVTPRDGPWPSEFHPALVSLGVQDPPREPAVIPARLRDRMALERVPVQGDRVVFYNAAVLTDPRPDETGGREGPGEGGTRPTTGGEDRLPR